MQPNWRPQGTHAGCLHALGNIHSDRGVCPPEVNMCKWDPIERDNIFIQTEVFPINIRNNTIAQTFIGFRNIQETSRYQLHNVFTVKLIQPGEKGLMV